MATGNKLGFHSPVLKNHHNFPQRILPSVLICLIADGST